MHKLGFYHFDQIAAWSAAEIAWVDDNLEGFKGRVTRDRWVAQAKMIWPRGSRSSAPRQERTITDDGACATRPRQRQRSRTAGAAGRRL